MLVNKRIMVCLDGFKYSEKALSQAIQIAKKFDSKIILVHVVEPTAVFSTMQDPAVPYWGSINAPLLQSSLYKEQKEGNKILTKNFDVLEKEGIQFDMVLLLGNLSEKILNFSKKKKTNALL